MTVHNSFSLSDLSHLDHTEETLSNYATFAKHFDLAVAYDNISCAPCCVAVDVHPRTVLIRIRKALSDSQLLEEIHPSPDSQKISYLLNHRLDPKIS